MSWHHLSLSLTQYRIQATLIRQQIMAKRIHEKRDYGELESNVIDKLSTTETNLSVYYLTRNDLVKS